MKASPELMMFAKVMLAIFIGLSIWSVFAMVRSFYRPLQATPEKLAATRKALFLNSWVMLAAGSVAIHAIATKQYFLLGAAAMLFSFALPLFVHYVRLKTALRGQRK